MPVRRTGWGFSEGRKLARIHQPGLGRWFHRWAVQDRGALSCRHRLGGGS